MEGNKSNQEMQGLCKEGCGFYGSSANEGFCSQCFKKRLRRWLHLNEPASTLPTCTTNVSTSNDTQSIPSTSNFQNTTAIDSTAAISTVSSSTASSTTVTSSNRIIIQSSVDPVGCGDEEFEKESEINEKSSNEASDVDKNLENNETEKVSSIIKTDIEEKNKQVNFESKNLSNEETPVLKIVEEKNVTKEIDEEITVIPNEEEKKPHKKNRCFMCNKKVGLTGFGCRCGDTFCGQHRYSDTHNCPFDYKSLGKQEVEKNNPKVAFEKVVKI